MESQFTQKQVELLDKKLDKRFVSDRKGASGRKLSYLEGHDAIDQADRLFGYGNWGYEILACEQTVIMDILSGEAIGVAYKAKVRLTVRGCMPVDEVGSQPVSVASVQDHIMTKRRKEANEKNQAIDESPFNAFEISLARTIIMEAHEQAEKGAVTDAVKRALRTFGEQFGNGLYGDGRVVIVDGDTLIEEVLQAEWAIAYKVAENEVEARWSKFKLWALQEQVQQLTGEHKATLFYKIQDQLKKSA
jgi:DNA repair and recombination protein RAD52